MAERIKLTDEQAKEMVTKAIANGAPTIYEISIATGITYAQVVRIVLKGLASHTYRLMVNATDGKPDSKGADNVGSRQPAGVRRTPQRS